MNFPPFALIRTLSLAGLFVPSFALATPDFDLFGGTAQAVEISDGDITPQTIDGTDWGQVDWQGGPVSKTFKITNNGDMELQIVSANVNGSSDFSVSGLPGIFSPIGVGLSATFTITFNPSAEAIRAAEIQIINTSGVSGENPFNFTVRGQGVTPPEIVVEGRESSSSSYFSIIDGSDVPLVINGTDFGSTSVSGFVIREFRIRNTGPGTLTISPSESSPDFSFFGLAATVGPGLADTFTITFSPTSTGTKTATFRIDNNDLDEDPFTFDIEGIGEDPDISISSVPPSYLQNVPDGQTVPSVTNDTDFGSQHIDDGGVTNAFRLRNSGNIDLDITSVSVTGADSGSFAITGLTSSSPDVSPSGIIDFDITFDPSTAGTKNATVEIESNDPDESPYTFAIRGVATGTPEISIKGSSDDVTFESVSNGENSPNSLNGTLFPSTALLTNAFHTFRVSNSGTDTLTLSGSSSDGSFTILNLASVAAGQSDDFEVRFRPFTAGVKTATITLDTNDPDDDPFTFGIQGTALGPEITVLGGDNQAFPITNGDTSPSGPDGTAFGSVELVSGSKTNTFKIVNDGNTALSVTSVTTGGGNATNFIVSNFTPGSIPGGGEITFDLTFDPSAVGSRSTTVTIANDDSNESPFTFLVNGTGITAPEIEVSGAQPGNGYMEIPIMSTTAAAFNGTLFPDVAVGLSATNLFRISNVGSLSLNYTITSSDPQFTIADESSSLFQGLDDDFTIEFTPAAGGLQSATITIDSNDADEDPYTFVVEGTGLVPDIALKGGGGSPPNKDIANGDSIPSTVDGTDFGTVLASSPAIYRTFRLTNEGGADLCVSSITFASPTQDFFLRGANSFPKVGPAGGLAFRIAFEPSSLGAKTATIVITSDDPDEGTFTFDVGGEVAKSVQNMPDLEISGNGNGVPAGADFVNALFGTDFGTASLGGSPVVRDFTLANLSTAIGSTIGSTDLLNISASSNNPAAVISGTPTALRAGETGTMTISFSPTTLGTQFASIIVSSNDPNENPYTFPIRLQVDPAPFVISEFEIDSSGGTGLARFPTMLGSTYQLKTSTNLAPGSWIQVPGTSTLTGTGNTETINFTIPTTNGSPTDPKRYYRVEETPSS